VDFVISVGVFKHFPSQAYTLRVLQVMGKLLKAGGFLFVQVRYFDGMEKYRSKEDDYARNVITMTSFTGEAFAAQVAAAGLALLHRARDVDGEEEKHEYYLLGKGT
jgi:SAM-dependent methyltransferase